jgi:hypothetical protein
VRGLFDCGEQIEGHDRAVVGVLAQRRRDVHRQRVAADRLYAAGAVPLPSFVK